MAASRHAPDAHAQVAAMLALLEQTRPGTVEQLRVDALTELGSWPDVRVDLVPEVTGAGGCSVAGSYDDEMQPPVLCVAESASVRRRQFTVLHELGHHLQNTDIGLAQQLLQRDDRFEDDVCDLFAARVLLPDSLVAGCFGDRAPTAGDVVRLYQASSASRAACVVRAAEHLTSPGAVVLLDDTGVVSFAAAHGIYPPARGSDQSATALVAAALRGRDRADGVAITAERTTIRYRTHDGGPLYGQAAWCAGWLVAVLVEDHAPWQAFSPARPTVAPRPVASADCEICTTTFEITDRCVRCREPLCPSGHCPCVQRRERRCDRCFLVWPMSRFPGGGTTCTDCA